MSAIETVRKIGQLEVEKEKIEKIKVAIRKGKRRTTVSASIPCSNESDANNWFRILNGSILAEAENKQKEIERLSREYLNSQCKKPEEKEEPAQKKTVSKKK